MFNDTHLELPFNYVSEILQLIEITSLLMAIDLYHQLRYWLFVISYSNNK